MLGLAKGIICDGVVNDAEIVALKQWIASNSDVTTCYPGEMLARRVLHALEDGVIDEFERVALQEFLFDLVGEPDSLSGSMREPTRLPLDEPVPTLLFDGQEYVFTGMLAAGTRDWASRQVTDRGGKCGKDVTRRTNFLVVGMLASEAWVQSTHGRKIMAAVRLRDQGLPVRIVGEQDWLTAIDYDAH